MKREGALTRISKVFKLELGNGCYLRAQTWHASRIIVVTLSLESELGIVPANQLQTHKNSGILTSKSV